MAKPKTGGQQQSYTKLTGGSQNQSIKMGKTAQMQWKKQGGKRRGR